MYNMRKEKIPKMIMEKESRIQWHPGFYGAAEIELRDDRDRLTFNREFVLGKMAPRLDLLIILKPFEEKTKNEIGHIFRLCNIVEYKSPDDALRINEFTKAQSYACLYKCSAECTARLNELTVTLVRQKKPVNLLNDLQELGYTVTERYHGIYYISGNLMFPTQIVVTDELEPENHSALRILAEDASSADVKRFLTLSMNYTKPEDRENIDAVLVVSRQANEKLYEEETSVSEQLRELFKDLFEKEYANGRAEGEARGRAETAKEYQNALAERDAENARLRAEISKLQSAAIKA